MRLLIERPKRFRRQQNGPLLERMSDPDWISYIDREKTSGEAAALRWAVSKFGQK
ncbi:MAG TPA: hypothetical protein VNZ22_01520 [Bacillota bacterium]|nr:hypothetical protein [Bacillota bacterium]